MKFNVNWLQDWINKEFSASKLRDQLTMAGIEVAGISSVAGQFSEVVVGEILSVNKHPDAQKLTVCEVNIGKKPLKIVCGAPNVYAGMMAPVALVGAKVGDFLIERRIVRGVESCGMLCSPKELGLSEDAASIMDLPKNAPIGAALDKYLQLDDEILEVELTPNRGDCASIRGIAREISTLNQCHYLMPPIQPIKSAQTDKFPIEIKAKEACPHYVGRIIRGIHPKSETPIWMRERLRRCGLSCIHPVVDVMNYVMLELGQPMHAFDLSKLSKKIIVRFAKPGERLTLLDEQTVELNNETLIIADSEKPLAIAGIMGGLDSAVSAETQELFLESAYFNPTVIAQSSRHYSLQTDSSYRFERSVDSRLQVLAIERATQLLLDIMHGKPGKIIDDTGKKYLPDMPTILLRKARIEKVLGLAIPDKDIKLILTRLGMQIREHREGWQVTAPSFRSDITLEVDLIEEVARIYGYDKIPAHTYSAPTHLIKTSEIQISERQIRQLLKDRGFHEVVTYSFIDPADCQLIAPNQKPLILNNPIANDMSAMRVSLWPGLLYTLKHNLHRQQTRVRIFETGLRFQQMDDQLKQEPVIAGLIYGSKLPEQWGEKAKNADFFDLKSDVEAILALTKETFEFRVSKHNALHPAQCAEIFKGDQSVGFIGALHPLIAQQLNISTHVYLFELSLEVLREAILPTYHPISKFPAIRRDLAFIFKQEVEAKTIQNEIRKQAGSLLTDLVIFDMYEGENLNENEKSLALGLTLQDSSRTLTDREVCDIIERVIQTLESNLGAKLRE